MRYIRGDVQDQGDDFFWQARVATVEGSRAVTLCFDHPKWYDQIQVLPGNSTVHVRTQPDAKGEIWIGVECPDVNKNEPHWFRMEHRGARFDFLIDGKKLASGLSTYASGIRRAWILAYPNGPTRVNWYGYEYGALAPKPQSSEPASH